MSLSANTRHSFGLILIATGIVGVMVSAIPFILAVKSGELALLGCSTVSGLLFAALLYLGVRIRNRAAPESTAFKEETGWTSETGTAMPSFLEDREKDKETDRQMGE